MARLQSIPRQCLKYPRTSFILADAFRTEAQRLASSVEASSVDDHDQQLISRHFLQIAQVMQPIDCFECRPELAQIEYNAGIGYLKYGCWSDAISKFQQAQNWDKHGAVGENAKARIQEILDLLMTSVLKPRTV
jgi:hypothetical protein